MIYSVCLVSVDPHRHVSHTESARSAQITARLLAERFPGMSFSYEPGPDLVHGDCHPSIRDSALSVEVQRLVEAELVIEAATNPKSLPKWCAFQHRNGGVVAHPDHDRRAVEICRRDCDVVQERAIYAVYPTPDELLERFRNDADMIA